jgi:putative methyltransferase (TIGR04325 family)
MTDTGSKNSFNIWEGTYTHFDNAPRKGKGFSGETWCQRTKASVGESLRALRENGHIPEEAKFRNYILPVLAALAAEDAKNLRILDFGGGMGNSFLPLLADMVEAKKVELHIVETDAVCTAGQELFADEPSVIFHSTLPDDQRPFDIVHAGSVLHYIRDWQEILAKLASYKPRYILLSDVLAGDIPTFASCQQYYGDTIPVWFWNIKDILTCIEGLGFRLLFKAPFVAKILGREGSLPMGNMPPDRRLSHTCHLLFGQINSMHQV